MRSDAPSFRPRVKGGVMGKYVLAFLAVSALVLAANDGHVWADKKDGHGKGHGGGYSKGHGFGMHRGTTGHLIRGLLSSSEEMGLTDEQTKKLKAIQLDLDRTRIRMEADIKIAEREARALVDNETSSLSAIEAKLKESSQLQVGLRMTAIKARRDVMGVLTPEQSKRVKMFHERMRQHMRSGDYGQGKGHGGKKGKKKEKEDDD